MPSSASAIAGASVEPIDRDVPTAAAGDLEALLAICGAFTDRGSWRSLEARRERLSSSLASFARHLDCVFGALLVPARKLRCVAIQDAFSAPDLAPESVLASLERPVLSRLGRKNEAILVNRGRAAGSAALRLLVVPVAAQPTEEVGALLLVRSLSAPAFTNTELALAKHVGCLISTSLAADRDAATGLHTRASLQAELGAWRAAGDAAGIPNGILCVKIDRLDLVNKTRGFDAGDALIVRMAGLLRDLQEPGGALAARISGNEFVLVLPQATPEQVQGTAERLQRSSAMISAGVGGSQEPVSLSCGIASFNSPGDFETGLALAQLACKTARRHGAGRIEVYRDTDMSMIQRHTDIIAIQLLREALREDRFTLFAQRIIPLQGGASPGGYEILLRHPDDLGENRAPAHLLAAAHRNHLAPAVDLWVVEHALAEAAPCRLELKEAHLSLSINLSGPSLTDQKFLERIRGLIEQSRLSPSLITFEITETVAVLSLAKAAAFIGELRALGCRFALDDFGTGTNSLKNLTSLPVDRVKIDGSFVSDLLTNRQSEAMVRAIVSLARDLGIDTVAEYAESQGIIDRLQELGVDHAQGYGIEKPRPFSEVLNEVRRGHRGRPGTL